MGITNSIRVLKSKKKLEKMKISGAVLFALASADDRKVPPRHPLQRLTRLTEFSAELLNQWYTWLPSKTHGLPNSKIMPIVWKETSSVASRDVAITTKTNFPMEDPLTESDDPMTNGTDTTVKTQLRVPSKSPLDTENGPNDTSPRAPVNVNISSKSSE